MKDLSGKLVLITGAASGIGKRMAELFGEEGARLALWDIDEARVREVARTLNARGARTRAYACDVSSREAVYETAAKVKKDLGQVDVLVNNAGIVTGRPFLECTDEQLERTIGVNLMAHFWTAKAFLPDMVAKNRGHIVTIASSAGWLGVNRCADYCASKFGNVGFDEALRMELRGQGATGVKTTCVCPYFIDTGMFEGVKTGFGKLLPILKEDDVSRKIVAAVKKDKPMLRLPWMVSTIPLFRLLPTRVMDAAADFLGVSKAMSEFQGRHGGAGH
ncbi:MAG: SDR family oxidoreductase [Desulfatibacillaceae bacterium]